MAARTAQMRHDVYQIAVNRKWLHIIDDMTGKEITIGQYRALLAAMQRQAESWERHLAELGEPELLDEEQPKWGEAYDE